MKTRQLNVILNSYNLINMVIFPTSIAGNSSSSIDNVFIDRWLFVFLALQPFWLYFSQPRSGL